MQDIHSLFSTGRPQEQPVFHDEVSLRRWGEFSAQVSSLANQLRGKREQRWLIESNNPGEFLIQLLALLFAGKQAVIPPNTQPGTLEELSSEVDARFWGMEAETKAGYSPLPAINPHTAVVYLYTSGSTGKPKKIHRTLAEFEIEIRILEALWGKELGEASVVATIPHQHVYGLVFRLLWPLCGGRIFDTMTCSHPSILEERLKVLGPSILMTTPAHLSRLPELLSLESLAPNLKKIFSAGSPLSSTISNDFFRATGTRPTEILGSTETGTIAWKEEREGEGGDIWSPLPGLKTATSPEGALRLYAPHVKNGQAYDMDDAIELLPDGRFLLRGRIDRIVKIEEKRLSLPEMESRLDKHPWVKSAAVVPIILHKQKRERQTLGAVVVLTQEGKQQWELQSRSGTIHSFRQYLATHFEAVLLPRYWRFVEHLPANERGKVTQGALRELFSKPTGKEETPVLYPNIEKVCPLDDKGHELLLTLHIPPELEHFSGHFENVPILPGVIQIDWAVRFAQKYLKQVGELENGFSGMERLKFLAPVPPDICLNLHLKWHPQTCRLDFAYSTPQRDYSTGQLFFNRSSWPILPVC